MQSAVEQTACTPSVGKAVRLCRQKEATRISDGLLLLLFLILFAGITAGGAALTAGAAGIFCALAARTADAPAGLFLPDNILNRGDHGGGDEDDEHYIREVHANNTPIW